TEPIERNTAATFTAFLDALDTAIDPAKQIHLVPGQRFQSHCQAHQSLVQGPPALAPALDAATRLVAEHDRDLVLHPGQTRDPPRRLPSRQDLADKIEAFTILYNQTTKTYRWTYDGTPSKRPEPQRNNAAPH
ncbi:MAG: hypothetical protein WAK38_11850, partial [Trebonia sp.]